MVDLITSFITPIAAERGSTSKYSILCETKHCRATAHLIGPRFGGCMPILSHPYTKSFGFQYHMHEYI